jgi:hypothetical protein
MVPMATDNSRKISGAVEMTHLTLSMIAFPRAQSSIVQRSDSRELPESLIQIKPRRV